MPGVIVEFGVWLGHDLALFESLRGVYEPYNYTRRIIGFGRLRTRGWMSRRCL